MTFLNDNDPPPAPPCPTSTADPGDKPPPPPEMKSPAPADNEVPGSLKLQGDNSENAGDDQSKNGLFLATNGALAAEAESCGEVSGSNLPVGQPSYLTPMSQRPKPDYELPTDSNGQPYGPMCIHHNANPANAEKWDDALAHWKQHEATPGEVATYEHAQTYRLDVWTKINDVRIKKDPAMPTFSNIAYEEIPYTLEGIDALRPKLNEVELDYIGTLTAVAETDPRYPAKTDCYCPREGRFYREVYRVWKSFTQTQYESQLFAEGFSGGSVKTRTIPRKCEIDKISQRVILRQVTVVKGLSGLDQGYHNMGPSAGEYLALTGPVFPEESEGEAPNMMAYLMELTNAESDDGEQLSRLLDWMADAYTRRKAVNRGQHRALLIAGPASSGKGLLKDIIATLLGGRHRATNASKYLLGKTEFNGEWMKADLLYLDDAVGDGKMATKIQTADAIKGVVAGGAVQHIHGKNKEGVDMPVWWRLVVCLNDTEEVLATLPPLIRGFDDKWVMIQAHQTLLSDDGDQTAVVNRIMDEIPVLARMLSVRPKSEDRFDGRGPKSWIAPGLRDKLLASSPETELLDILIRARDSGVVDSHGNPIKLGESSRDNLHNLLAKNVGSTYINLCRTGRALGNYLRRLEEHGWITSRVKDGYPIWSWADARHSGK